MTYHMHQHQYKKPNINMDTKLELQLPLQPNVQRMLDEFNKRLDDAVSQVKEKMAVELVTQINRNDFMCKLNRAGDVGLFPDVGITLDTVGEVFKRYYNCAFSSSDGVAAISDISKNVRFQEGEYIINFKHQQAFNSKAYFVLIITNFGSIVVKSWSSSINAHTRVISDEIFVKSVYAGKFKLADDILYILNGIVDAYLPYIMPGTDDMRKIEDENRHHYVSLKQTDQYQTNCAINKSKVSDALSGKTEWQMNAMFFCRFENIIGVIKTYQDNYVIPLINQTAQQIATEMHALDLEQVEVDKLQAEQEQTKRMLIETEEKIRGDLQKFSNIKLFEEKYAEIQKYKEQLDAYAKKLNEDRKQYEIERASIEKQKVEVRVNQINLSTSFASFLAGFGDNGGN